MLKKMDICFICNGHEHAINLGISIVSILINSDIDDNFCFHIMTNDMSKEDMKKIILLKEIKDFDIYFYDIDENIVDKYKKTAPSVIGDYWGYHVFLKLEIQNILKNLDKVLYLDTDILCLKSLKEIFNENIDDYYLLASDFQMRNHTPYYIREDGYELIFKEILPKNLTQKNDLDAICKLYTQRLENYIKELKIFDKKADEWVNSGFMYMNLKKIRETYNEKKIFEYFDFLIKMGIYASDEGLINYFISNSNIKRVSSYHYNAVSATWLYDKYIDDIYIAHCTCGKIFDTYNYWMPKYKNKVLLLGWKYLTMTPWFKEDPVYFLEHYSKYNTYYINNELTNIKDKLTNIKNINKANEEKLNKFINKIVWFIPLKNIRDNIRKKMRLYFNI